VQRHADALEMRIRASQRLHSSVIDPEHGERNDSLFVIYSIQHRSMKGEYRYRDEPHASWLSSWLRRVDEGLHVRIQITFAIFGIYRSEYMDELTSPRAIARRGAECED